jgi:hypothetical protein
MNHSIWSVKEHTVTRKRTFPHAEARCQYDNEKMISKIKNQREHIKSEKDPSQARYFLRENHVLKPHDSAGNNKTEDYTYNIDIEYR